MIRNNQRRRRGGGNNGPRPQQMAGGNNYGNRLDNRQRGNATQLLEKYRALARDAQQAGDRVTAEYYLQYAEHYFRVLGDYRERPADGRADGRRGRDAYDDDMGDGEDADGDSADNDADDDDGERASRDDRARDDRARDDRNRDDRNREDRARDDRSRDNRGRNERPRDDRPRQDRPREERARDDRPREDRPREELARDDRPRDDRNRRDWQRDRRDRAVAPEPADDRESLLQALPPPVSASPRPAADEPEAGRRLGLKRERPAEVRPAAEAVPDEAPAAPVRRPRAKKPVAEPAAD